MAEQERIKPTKTTRKKETKVKERSQELMQKTAMKLASTAKKVKTTKKASTAKISGKEAQVISGLKDAKPAIARKSQPKIKSRPKTTPQVSKPHPKSPKPAAKIETENFSSFPTSTSASTSASTVETLKPFPVSESPSVPLTTQVDPILAAIDAAAADPLDTIQAEYEKLSAIEQEVLIIAKKILKKKKYKADIKVERVEMMSPLVDLLYSKCVGKLTHARGFTKEQIFGALQDLQKKLWIVTDQRRTKEEILNNPILRKVLTFIHEHPGTHARDPLIEVEVGITRNPFIKHVMVLEAFGLVRAKKIGRTQNYFIDGVPEIFDDYVVLFHNPLVPQILSLILNSSSIGISQIAREAGVYHGAIQYHIKNLVKQNLIFKGGDVMQVNRELLKRYNQVFKVPPFGIVS